MIQIPPKSLPSSTSKSLQKYQAVIDSESDFGRRVQLAARKFSQYNRAKNTAFAKVKDTLDSMCSGARRCMYCEDSVADEVEHHHPKTLYPEYTFVWSNYLYACGPCNGPKNSRFAVYRNGAFVEITYKPGTPPLAGKAVLLHPRTENPLDYLMLDIAGDTFFFVPTAPAPSREFVTADYTIRLLRLNDRDYLPVARREAYASYKARVEAYGRERDRGASATTLASRVRAVRRMQHPTVWFEMARQRSLIPELTQLFADVPEALTW
jgi:uncharacterized protein (TIGR02646 family)